MKRQVVLEVEWEDSSFLADQGWVTMRDALKNRSITRCRSVGLILADDKRGIVLASSVHGQWTAGVLMIPRSQVLRRRRLRRG